ncbi:hypothetical protein [Helicobacter pylori]|uniref:hypothetical protein n=1 Tax=Helicobacter pylori TaxID=210 RepID=UPI00196916EB|nr:hypothetical protein [Helicobacter pylori]
MLKSSKKPFLGLYAWVRWFIGGEGLKWQEPNPKRACPFGYEELQRARFFSS